MTNIKSLDIVGRVQVGIQERRPRVNAAPCAILGQYLFVPIANNLLLLERIFTLASSTIAIDRESPNLHNFANRADAQVAVWVKEL